MHASFIPPRPNGTWRSLTLALTVALAGLCMPPVHSEGRSQTDQPAAAPLLTRQTPLSGSVSLDVLGLSDDLDHANRMVEVNPHDPEAHFLMAVAYSRTPYAERALIALVQAKKLARRSPEGFALFDRKIREYESMRRKTPDDPMLLYRMGFGYYMRGYAAQRNYITNDPHPADYYYDLAEQAMRQVIQLDPQDYMAMNYLGFFLAERDPDRYFDEAVALWRQSLALNTQNPGAYALLGQAAMRQGHLKDALHYSALALKARNEWLKERRIDPSQIKIRI